MCKTKVNNRKNPRRDDFGMVGNFGREQPILFPRVSQKWAEYGLIQMDNPFVGTWMETNDKPP